MATENYDMCPFEAMDHLWFHQIVISSKPPNYSSKHISQISVTIPNQQIPSSSSAVASSQVASKRQESDHVEETSTTSTPRCEDRAAKLYLVSTKTRPPRSLQKQCSRTSMRKALSSADLELEEVRGFMDLGFDFKEHNLSRHMISLIPGLQRIKSHEQDLGSRIDVDEEKNGKFMRPYWSESWLVKMLDSPLILSLRISDDSDKVKKHLKDWARMVAATIHQES
ncbi:hypothetical protein SASPL_135978 [Salvia splendens]|uniref:Uncharacterized protein n=1 Tax=Salvia splendens TaxID=180675 RepID=A0A8X8WYZ3_SALSN|nr:uncharacterized protein LOC121761452 [Salvia splendens]KAG6403748.1 hypothetical protein SASPL_135978 [Salvia splendens]